MPKLIAAVTVVEAHMTDSAKRLVLFLLRIKKPRFSGRSGAQQKDLFVFLSHAIPPIPPMPCSMRCPWLPCISSSRESVPW